MSRPNRLYHYDLPAVAPKNASEISIQASCKMRVEREFQARWVAVPNGTYIASAAGRGKARREGLSKGFPDAMIVGHGPNAGKIAFPEIKAKSDLREEQDAWLTYLSLNGFQTGVFRSQETLAAWLGERCWK